MKSLISRIILSEEFQLTIWAGLMRRIINYSSGLYRYSPMFLLDSQAIERPHYAYCMLNAALLGKLLGHSRISALEFGVAGGNGFNFMCKFANEVERLTGVAVECYGFDTGEGMPPPQDKRDLPYWFKEKQYTMDMQALAKQGLNKNLIIGDIKNTIPSFLDSHNPPPIGAIFNDLDYWSSTRDSLRIFEGATARPENFLPRLFMYFDDVIGSKAEMYGAYNGQLAAISEFNNLQDATKIHLNQNLLPKSHIKYRFQIYYAHIFAHPLYEYYMGGLEQDSLEKLLRLK
ncbi:MAG TPA: hypothetical protein VM144_18065 [Aestuariivirga sp.]|nr:hypothetical protein [Aestuariivirga sp.]